MPKIAVVGCGALGSYYGAKLCRHRHEVHFLLRSDYETVQQRGVSIRSRDGDFHVRPRCATAPQDIGPCDLVLIGLKTTANDQFYTLLPPLVDSRTALLTLQNGLGNEEALAKLFAPAQILGALCFVCLNRLEPGLIHHIDHGHIVLGEYQRPPEPRTRELATLFRQAGVSCELTDNLARTHWEKLVWNIPFNGVGVASAGGLDAFRTGQLDPATPRGPCLTTDRLLADPNWERIVRQLMAELVRAAQALGLPVADDVPELQIKRTRTMGAYKPSTLIDYERGQPIELHSLFLEPLRLAKSVGVNAPALEKLCAILRALAPPGSC